MVSNVKTFDLAELAFDTDVSKMLAMSYSNPRGVRKLGEALEISQARRYRRINDLENLGLLKAMGSSKRNRTYSSNMGRITLAMNENSISLTTEFKDGNINYFDLKQLG